mgnify:CR=1 FL=1
MNDQSLLWALFPVIDKTAPCSYSAHMLRTIILFLSLTFLAFADEKTDHGVSQARAQQFQRGKARLAHVFDQAQLPARADDLHQAKTVHRGLFKRRRQGFSQYGIHNGARGTAAK